MDPDTREMLVDRFRAYLEETAETAISEPAPDTGHTDLFSLFTELIALKNEVRLETRQTKTTLDELKAGFATLQKERQRAALRPLLLELLELWDRLEAGLQVVQNHRPALLARLSKRETALLAALQQGQEISLRRLQQLLSAQRIIALEVAGQPLDPHTMRAVEMEQRLDLDSGIVTEELRRGFTWEDELLRPAEVKVNKHPES